MSKQESIGLLEEMVLLIVLKNTEINGAEVTREYIDSFQKSISLPAIISVLKRLEKKGFLTSKMGESTKERGGKRKRLYKSTSLGYNTVTQIQSFRNKAWQQIVPIES